MARSGGERHDALDNVGYGLHYAVVCQNQDKDSKLNRIKVRLPWLDGGDTDQTHWAQLMTPMEGKEFGQYVLPDVDDVVVVMFMQGDTTMPVVIGGVWSTPDNSPEPNSDGKNNFRGYRSRSGHRMILDDSDKGKVVIADKTNKNVIGMGEFDKAGDGPNVCEVFTPPMAGKTGMSFSSMEGTFEITCKDGILKINAEQNIKINATTTIDIKAGQDIKMEGQSTAKISSTAPSNYDAPQVNIG
jgi:uncharacterized protein involved in type VI secretion and phage assembly